MPRRPLIAITATTEVIRGISRVRVNEAYTRSVERAGMLPVIIPPFEDERRAAAIAATVDGILLTGGEDVDPARYSASPHPRTEAPHYARDRSEIALVVAAKTMAVPTLAICRGLQVLNVALGGTLIQDIATRCRTRRHRPGGEFLAPSEPRSSGIRHQRYRDRARRHRRGRRV